MLSFSGSRFSSRKSLRRHGAPAPAIEALEERTLLSAFTVLNLNDHGTGSLRQAILDANSNPGADVINFNVAGTITLASALPTIIGQVNIDGTTAPGFAGTPAVEVNFHNFGGLQFLAFDDGSSLRSLSLVGASGNAVTLEHVENMQIVGNYIGLDTDGTTAAGNRGDGIELIEFVQQHHRRRSGRRSQRHFRQRPAGHSRQPFVEQHNHEQRHRHRRHRHGCPRQRG